MHEEERMRRVGTKIILDDDYDDEVYHINPGPGSYSTQYFPTFDDRISDATTSEDEPLPLRVLTEQRMQELTIDLHSQMRGLGNAIGAGNRLVLHRAVTDDHQRKCVYLRCILTGEYVTGGQLYLHAATGNIPPSGGIDATRFVYHLSCLESLWQGDAMQDPLPPPEVYCKERPHHQRALLKMVDHHLHHPPQNTTQTHPASRQSFSSSSSASSISSADSIMRVDSPRAGIIKEDFPHADHYKLYTARPINRFQHLAEFIHIGENLSAKQIATIRLWQATSSFQFAARNCQASLAARGESSETSPKIVHDKAIERKDVSDLESRAKLRSLNCRSKNLTEVLDLATWT